MLPKSRGAPGRRAARPLPVGAGGRGRHRVGRDAGHRAGHRDGAEAMFTTGSYQGAPRVVALTWGAEDLADSVGASGNREPDGSYGFTYELARSLCLLGAAAAGVTPVDTIHGRLPRPRGAAPPGRTGPPRRLPGHAGHPPRPGRRDQRGLHADRGGTGRGPGDRRPVRRQPRRRRHRPQGRHARPPVPGPGPGAARGPARRERSSTRRPGPPRVPAPRRPHRPRPRLRRADHAGRGADRPGPGASAACRPSSPPASPGSSPRRPPTASRCPEHGRDRRAAHADQGAPARRHPVPRQPDRPDDRGRASSAATSPSSRSARPTRTGTTASA